MILWIIGAGVLVAVVYKFRCRTVPHLRVHHVSSTQNSSDTNKQLNDWIVDQYAANPHLYNIPASRIAEKRAELLKQHTNKQASTRPLCELSGVAREMCF